MGKKRGSPANTQAIVALQRAKIPHRVYSYNYDSDSDVNFGMQAASALGVAPELVYKTLMIQAGDALAAAIIPVTTRVDLKELARVLGVKLAELADPKAAERATGYVVGGISPLGQKRRHVTVIDISCLEHEYMFVSAGARGLNVSLAPHELLSFLNALTGKIATAI